jgi:SDR family mycofactocin-dependent oxidoreductase
VVGKLDERVALVTGGARGQGRSHALAMAAEGAAVVVCDLAADLDVVPYPLASRSDLEETVRLIEAQAQRALGLVADMRDTDQVQGVVERVISEFGRLDILVANQGIVNVTTIEKMTDVEWETVLDTNLGGIFKVIRAVLPHMKRAGYGRIVATSSMGARKAHQNMAHYIASKWGVIGLVKACSLEVANDGITVNAICPAAVGTDLFFNQAMYDLFCPDIERPTKQDFENRLKVLNYGLNGRPYVDAEHVSRALMYLVTDDDGVISGQVMDVALGGSATGIH